MSKLFACCVPLQKNISISSNIKKYAQIESSKISVLPIFKIRKCIVGSETCSSPCCLYIDDHGRVYKDWNDYKENNKLPKGVLVLPKNGTYNFQEIEINVCVEIKQVSLDIVLSPASSTTNKVKNFLNIAGTSVGLTSAGIFATAIFLPVAGPIMITATAGMLATSAVGTTMSSMTLIDRKKHKQSIGLKDPESRGAWLNIGASVCGIAASASSQILAASVNRGIAIGKIAKGAHNGLIIASTFTNGLGVTNGVYIMIDRYKMTGETPTTLEWLQVSSSVLFFCHSVLSFKTASVLIEETQLSTIGQQRGLLRSNRHRKIFDKMAAETRRQNGNVKGNTQIIRSMKTITNKDSFFASTLKMNKQFNKNQIKISFGGTDDVLLNGQHNVSPDVLINLNPTDRAELFTDIGPSRLVAKNCPTKVSFPNISSNSVTYRIKSIVNIVNMCDSHDKMEWLVKTCVSAIDDDSFSFLGDLIRDCIGKLYDLAYEKMIAINIVDRNGIFFFLFKKFTEIIKALDFGERLSNILETLKHKGREYVINLLVSKFNDWLNKKFSEARYAQKKCFCDGFRFAD